MVVVLAMVFSSLWGLVDVALQARAVRGLASEARADPGSETRSEDVS